MSFGQVHNMDVIPYSCAVGCGVVAAENAQPLTASHGHLADVGHQVVWIPPGVLADEPAGMSSDGVEVAQQCNLPGGIGSIKILKDLLDHEFGSAVGVGRRQGKVLPDGDGVRIAVNGGR